MLQRQKTIIKYRYCDQIDSVAMGSPLVPVLTNILIPGDFIESWVMTSKNIDDFHTTFEQ